MWCCWVMCAASICHDQLSLGRQHHASAGMPMAAAAAAAAASSGAMQPDFVVPAPAGLSFQFWEKKKKNKRSVKSVAPFIYWNQYSRISYRHLVYYIHLWHFLLFWWHIYHQNNSSNSIPLSLYKIFDSCFNDPPSFYHFPTNCINKSCKYYIYPRKCNYIFYGRFHFLWRGRVDIVLCNLLCCFVTYIYFTGFTSIHRRKVAQIFHIVQRMRLICIPHIFDRFSQGIDNTHNFIGVG